ncbi:MAG TPA: hypothetical protein PKW90_20815, partial [Myxococcota bacterium]|nr:hypothetical protein [Myxococcota bacterium]
MGNRLLDVLAQQDPEAATEPMDRDSDRPFVHSQADCHLRGGLSIAVSGKLGTKFTEELGLALRGTFLLQAGHRAGEQGQRPLAMKELFRTVIRGRGFQLIPLLGVGLIQGDELTVTASLLTMSPRPFPGKKVVQKRQQEGAKATLVSIGQSQMLLGDELKEELLSQVLGFIRSV